MPLFEYRCRECGTEFEEIVSTDSIPRCPCCETTDLEKLHSAFAVGRGGASARSSSPSIPVGGG
jgi:putative FmdB family regulatory protein